MGVGSLIFMLPHFTAESMHTNSHPNSTSDNICRVVPVREQEMDFGRLSSGTLQKLIVFITYFFLYKSHLRFLDNNFLGFLDSAKKKMWVSMLIISFIVRISAEGLHNFFHCTNKKKRF